MWNTPIGERILKGKEAAFFCGAVAYLVDYVNLTMELDEELSLGIEAFDQLTGAQKLAMLEAVGHALLKADIPAPPRTAVAEATVAAVFHHSADGMETGIRTHVTRRERLAKQHEREAKASDVVDEFGEDFVRRELVETLRACGDGDVPAADNDNVEEWKEATLRLLERILPDVACLDHDAVRRARIQRALAGRCDDPYFGPTGPDPATISVETVRGSLAEFYERKARRLTGDRRAE